MRTKNLIMIAATFVATASATLANATEPSVTSTKIEVQQTQTVTAIYVGQSGLNSILIKVQGNYIVAYCSGRDYQGRQIWDDIQPVKIYPNNGGARTSDQTINLETSRKRYRAQLGQLTIYF